ncbi:uncharacterized protein LOC135428647 [Drosophila montana]|uniref:uncharacterized protein LOC135428647 n=1 Tax=Drosophila montana TaxID=40370 RepID=UPI00313CB8A0
MIAQFIEEHQSPWDEMLHEIALAVNTSVADTTGFSPAFLVQGREPRLPAALYDDVTPGSATVQQTPGEKAGRLREVFDIVRHNLQRASQDQGRHYNLCRREWRLRVNEQVWLHQHQLSKTADRFAAKIAPKFDGLYWVVKFVLLNIVRLARDGEWKRRVKWNEIIVSRWSGSGAATRAKTTDTENTVNRRGYPGHKAGPVYQALPVLGGTGGSI